MKRTREFNKQDSNYSTLAKNHHVELTPNHNSCGGCNSCHQMTGMHYMTGSPVFGGSRDGVQGSNIQKPCATNFFQRNLGNSYMQNISGNLQTSVTSFSGNSAPMIQRKCSCGGSCSGCSGEEELQGIQTKLTVGSPNDVYEQEADRIADQVMRMPESSTQHVSHTNDEINIQKLSAYDGGTPVSYQGIELNQSGGTPLTSSIKNFMEPRFGAEFGHVRLHTGQDAHQIASHIQARAFTYGHHIWLGKGESASDNSLISHELTHVLQQSKVNGQYAHRTTTAGAKTDKLPVSKPIVSSVSTLHIQRDIIERFGCTRMPHPNTGILTCFSLPPPHGCESRGGTCVERGLGGILGCWCRIPNRRPTP